MDGIPTSYAAALFGAAAVQQAQQQRRASRLLAQRLAAATPAGSIDPGNGTPVEPSDRALSVAPQSTGAPGRLDVRA